MNQMSFPPVLCSVECELVWEAYRKRLSAWRAAARRGRGGRKPDPPERCGEDALLACCGGVVECGEHHGHPTDEEEREMNLKLEQIRIDMERDADLSCYVCDGTSSHTTIRGKRVCAPCALEIKQMVRRRANRGK